jgi:hypothetical protein
MSRKAAVILLVLAVLVGAMGLKTVATAHTDGTIIMAHGGGPVPPVPFKHGGGPVPPVPFKHGGGPVPPVPFK